MKVTTIGFDLAKNVFQVHGVDEREQVVVRKQLRRDQVAVFFANLPACLVGMEARAAVRITGLGSCRGSATVFG